MDGSEQLEQILRLRGRVRARLRGEEADRDQGAVKSLGQILAEGEPQRIAQAFYRMDEFKARLVEGDIGRPPAFAAVTDEELGAMLAALELAAPGEAAVRLALALPAEYDELALRLLVGMLDREVGTEALPAALARAYPALPRVFSPYGRWLLARALAAHGGDREEASRADEQYRRSATIGVRADRPGRLVIDGYPLPAADEPVRVAPGRHRVAVITDTVTHLQFVHLQAGERREVRLRTRLLSEGFEPVGGGRHPVTGRPLRIRSLTDDVEMVYVPPGAFTMGLDVHQHNPVFSSIPVPQLLASSPAHQVTLRDFYIDARPAGVGVFRRFLQRGGYANRNYWGEAGWFEHHGLYDRDRLTWETWVHQDGRRKAPEEPVTQVTWFEAQACARWAHKRLPTEAEWERAVLIHGAHALGVVQAEWCADSYAPNYTKQDVSDPYLEALPRDPKVVRGVLISYQGNEITARIRGEAPPYERFWTVGFRTVWVP